MKKHLILIGIMAFMFAACKQEAPLKVQHIFTAKFDKAKNIEWSQTNINEWKAHFNINEKPYSATFENDGAWKETTYNVELSDVPDATKLKLGDRFDGYEIKNIKVSEIPDGVFYEFKLNRAEEKLAVIIDDSGNLISSEKREV